VLEKLNMKLRKIRINIILLIIFIQLLFFFESCEENKSKDFSGQIGKFWLVSDSNITKNIGFRYGLLFYNNNAGIFYSKSNGIEQLVQPDLYDAIPQKISDCFFQWELNNGILYITQNRHYTVMYKVDYIDENKMILINNGNKIYYTAVRDIELLSSQ
jgi:hypothetical protein